MGSITLLSGQPKEGVLVEARSESKGYYEETLTDSSGRYRLRGLLPDTIYVIKVGRKGELDNIQIERASPESVAIEVCYIYHLLWLLVFWSSKLCPRNSKSYVIH